MELIERFLLFVGLACVFAALDVIFGKHSKEDKLYMGAIGFIGMLLALMILDNWNLIKK